VDTDASSRFSRKRYIQPSKTPGFLVSHVSASTRNDIATIHSANLQFIIIIVIIMQQQNQKKKFSHR